MQSDFLAVGAPLEVAAGRAMIPQLKRAIDFCRERKIPVIFTAHVHRGDGCDMGLFKLNASIAGGNAPSEGEPGAAIYGEKLRRGACASWASSNCFVVGSWIKWCSGPVFVSAPFKFRALT